MKLLHLSANPHVRDRVTSAELMRDVVIAMLPTAIYGALQWGFHALLVVVIFPAKEINRKQRAAKAGFMKLAPKPP